MLIPASLLQTSTVRTLHLVGVGGEVIPLLAPGVLGRNLGGVFLKELPGVVQGTVWGNQWGRAVGQVGATFRTAVVDEQPVSLQVQVRGLDCKARVAELIDAVSGEFLLVANSPERGVWALTLRADSVSEPLWVGVQSGLLAELTITGTAGRPRWWRNPVTRVDTAQTILVNGGVKTEWQGTEPFWPRFTIGGAFTRVEIGLGGGYPAQSLAYEATGWVVDTDPMSRVVQPVGGTAIYRGFVPYWPEPFTPDLGVIPVTVIGAGDGFTFKTTYTPEVKRAW